MDLGAGAKPAIPALEKLAAGKNIALARAAKSALDRIRKAEEKDGSER